MDLDLVGYLFDLLDPADRARTEAALRADPAARADLDRLRANLAPLAAAVWDEPPPAGLVDRTLALVAGWTGARRPAPAGRTIFAGDREPFFAPSRWGRLDAVIAASIFILVGGLGMSGIGRVQNERSKIRCRDNLRQIGHGFAIYNGEHNGRYPQISDRPPNNFAGAFVPMLQDGGYLPAGGLPSCPLVNVAAEPNAGGYAYSLGVRGPDGQLYGLRRMDGDLHPILADQAMPVSHGNGYNVLFIGGNVRFCPNPNVGVGGDHIFLNRAGIIAAGTDRNDAVLGEVRARP